jgi:hypothetical protein
MSLAKASGSAFVIQVLHRILIWSSFGLRPSLSPLCHCARKELFVTPDLESLACGLRRRIFTPGPSPIGYARPSHHIFGSSCLRTIAKGGSPNSSPLRLRVFLGAPGGSTSWHMKRCLKRHPSVGRVCEGDLNTCSVTNTKKIVSFADGEVVAFFGERNKNYDSKIEKMSRSRFLIKYVVAPTSIRIPSSGARAKATFHLVGTCSHVPGAGDRHYISKPPGKARSHTLSAFAPQPPVSLCLRSAILIIRLTLVFWSAGIFVLGHEGLLWEHDATRTCLISSYLRPWEELHDSGNDRRHGEARSP